MVNNTTFSEIVFKNSQLLMKNQLKAGDRMVQDFWRSNEDQGQGYDQSRRDQDTDDRIIKIESERVREED